MAKPKVETITGKVFYTPVDTTVLVEGTGAKARTSLMLVDNPPLGLYDNEDIAAAYRLLHDRLKVPEGQKITIQAIRDSVANRSIIAIVRLDAVMNVMFGGKQ